MATEDNASPRAGTRKSPAKRAARGTSGEGESPSRGAAPRATASKKLPAAQIAAAAARQLLELTGREAEGVTGLQRTDDGWQVQVEVVEVRRIPDTTDVLALYEVEMDTDGAMEGYRRLRRYARGVPGEH